MHVQGRRDLRLGSRIRRRQKQNRMHIPFSGVSYSYVCLPVLLALSFREPRTSHGLERNMCHYFAQGGADSMRAPNLTVLSVRNGGLTWAMSQTAHELRPYVRFVQSCRNDPMPKDFQGIFGNRCYPWQFLPSS